MRLAYSVRVAFNFSIDLIDSLGKIYGFILALILRQCPIIGGVMGIIGAVKAWEWPWWGAALLFFGIPILLILFNAFAFRND